MIVGLEGGEKKNFQLSSFYLYLEELRAKLSDVDCMGHHRILVVELVWVCKKIFGHQFCACYVQGSLFL